ARPRSGHAARSPRRIPASLADEVARSRDRRGRRDGGHHLRDQRNRGEAGQEGRGERETRDRRLLGSLPLGRAGDVARATARARATREQGHQRGDGRRHWLERRLRQAFQGCFGARVKKTDSTPRSALLRPGIELRFPPKRAFVTRIATMVRQFCRELIGEGDALSRVNMATHELVENVVKYSAGGLCELRVELRLDGPTPVVSIETANDVGGDALEALEQLLVAVQQAPDPV